MDNCPACRHPAPSNSRFCPSCGAKLEPPPGDPTGTFRPAEETEHRGKPALMPGGRFAPGEVLAGRYRIVSKLGKGGMGEVYRADDLRLAQSVALKFLPDEWADDARRLAHLHEEVKLARQISHPNVCRVYDIGEADGHTFLSMEFIDGEDLASLLRRIGRLPPDKGIEIARQLCLGLSAAHEKGVMHRDLKPANIMLDGRGHVRITDFGLARLADQVTGPEAGFGTPTYMAPEQLAGKEATVKSDLFALGLVLYEVFTGKKAFEAPSRAELLRLHEESTPTGLSTHVTGLDPAVERVILRCLEKDPRHRPASAIAVAAALPGGDPLAAALAAGEVPSPEMVAAAGDAGAWRPAYAVACCIGVVLALIGCVLLYGKGMLLGRVGMPNSTDVLSYKAEEILATLKFEPCTDKAVGFDHDEDYLRWLQENDPSPNRWDRLENPLGKKHVPAALYFWSRQSPKYLVPNLFYPYAGTLEPGRITLSDPAPVAPDMVSVKLDVHGRLLELHAVPSRKEATGPAGAPNWQALFKAAGLELGDFDADALARVPPAFADERMAWKPKPGHAFDPPFRVEAATFRGRPVYFQKIYPWTNQSDESIGSQGTLDDAAKVALAVFFTAILLAATALAPHNWYLGRADRQGAMRLAFWTFVILMFVWVLETHHILGFPDIRDELRLLTSGLAFALSWAGLLWLTYIALEPYVRQLWPESLITWTRLLAGQWRDPRVGRDILLGVLAGLLFQIIDQLGRTLPAWLGEATPTPYFDWWIPNTLVRGYWIGNFVINLVYCFRWAFFDKLLVFLVLRVLLRRPLPAAIVFVIYSTAVWIGTSAGFEPSWYWLFGVLLQTLSVCLLIRVGVLAVIAAYFAWYTVCFPLTTNLTESTLLAVGAVLLMAGYGAYVSLAGRSLFRDAPAGA